MRHWLRLQLHNANLLRTSRVFLSFINNLDTRSDHVLCCTLLVLERALVTLEMFARSQAWSKYSNIAVSECRMGRSSSDGGSGVNVPHRMIIFCLLALTGHVIIRGAFLYNRDQKAWSVSNTKSP